MTTLMWTFIANVWKSTCMGFYSVVPLSLLSLACTLKPTKANHLVSHLRVLFKRQHLNSIFLFWEIMPAQDPLQLHIHTLKYQSLKGFLVQYSYELCMLDFGKTLLANMRESKIKYVDFITKAHC